jgi:hypothetical protein
MSFFPQNSGRPTVDDEEPPQKNSIGPILNPMPDHQLHIPLVVMQFSRQNSLNEIRVQYLSLKRRRVLHFSVLNVETRSGFSENGYFSTVIHLSSRPDRYFIPISDASQVDTL